VGDADCLNVSSLVKITMSYPSIEKPLVFLLGAGFSRDAASEAEHPMAPSNKRPAQYPLVNDLLDRCFGKDILPPGKSVEDLFQDCIGRGDWKPLDALREVLMEADYSITPHLKRGGSHDNNVYLRFLRDFPAAPLLTFNYDSLPEILLLAEGSWCPIDGYGVPVQAQQKKIRRGSPPVGKSRRPVLHLHGSLCVYAATFYIDGQPELGSAMLQFDRKPEFLFDPDGLGNCFSPFERNAPGVTYIRPPDRVIAPIPNKAEGLKGEFIIEMYRRAEEFLSTAIQIIVIGYSFNQNDRASYAPLLAAIANKPVLLIAPNADSLIERLLHEHRNAGWDAQNMSFKEWVNSGYPRVRK
jgi:hypothetical protein